MIAYLLWGNYFWAESVRFEWGKSAFAIRPFYVLIPLFLLLTFMLYTFRTFWTSFRHSLPAGIFVFTGLTLLLSLTVLAKTLSPQFIGSYVSYGPIATLGTGDFVADLQHPAMVFPTNALLSLQALVLCILLLGTFRWGQRNKAQTS